MGVLLGAVDDCVDADLVVVDDVDIVVVVGVFVLARFAADDPPLRPTAPARCETPVRTALKKALHVMVTAADVFVSCVV